MTLWRCQARATDGVDTQKTRGRIIGLASSWRFRSCWCGPPDDPGSGPDADRQAPGDEEGDRRPGTSAGRDHAPHLGRLSSAGPGRLWQHESRKKSNITGEHSSSTAWWNDVACGTMDEVSSYVRLEPAVGLTATHPRIVPPRLRTPRWKGLGVDSEEKREPANDINTAVVDSLKVLDPEPPIREADIGHLLNKIALTHTRLALGKCQADTVASAWRSSRITYPRPHTVSI